MWRYVLNINEVLGSVLPQLKNPLESQVDYFKFRAVVPVVLVLIRAGRLSGH